MLTYIIFLLPGIALALWASFKTKKTFNKYAKVNSAMGYTGAEAAKIMLEKQGVANVTIKVIAGNLTDHYDPRNKSLALSEQVYSGTSLSAIGVACHEAGHAIQHAENYAFLNFRSAIVPLVGFASKFSFGILFLGFILASQSFVIIGIILFSITTLFTIITLPVEWDASMRAKKAMISVNLLNQKEQIMAGEVLNAAFLTYLAAALSSVITLVYYLTQFGND